MPELPRAAPVADRPPLPPLRPAGTLRALPGRCRTRTLTAGETKLAGVLNAMPNVTNRTWEYWTLRLARTGGLPPRATDSKARPQAASKARTSSPRTPARGHGVRKNRRRR